MNIPDFRDIYRFPEYPHCHCRPHKPEYMPSHAYECSKQVDIDDAYGNLRYVVQLSSGIYAKPETEFPSRGYNTLVYKIDPNPLCAGQEISAFLVIPEHGHEFNYASAMNDFDTCVQRYTNLINAEQKDFDTIDIYADKIDYKTQCLSCCESCKYSKFDNRVHKLECHNPQNQLVFNYMVDFPPFPSKKHCCEKPPAKGWPAIPRSNEMKHLADGWHCPHEDKMLPIYPAVDPWGICDKYERNPKLSCQS